MVAQLIHHKKMQRLCYGLLLAVLLALPGCRSPDNGGLKTGTGKLLNTEASIYNRLLHGAGLQPLEAVLQNEAEKLKYRVIFVREIVEIDDSTIPHERNSSFILTELQIRTELFRHAKQEKSSAGRCSYSLRQYHQLDSGEIIRRLSEESGFLSDEQCGVWFDMIWEYEIFSLSPDRPDLRDNRTLRLRMGPLEVMLIERSSHSDYRVIERPLYAPGSLGVIEAQILKWFPQIGLEGDKPQTD